MRQNTAVRLEAPVDIDAAGAEAGLCDGSDGDLDERECEYENGENDGDHIVVSIPDAGGYNTYDPGTIDSSGTAVFTAVGTAASPSGFFTSIGNFITTVTSNPYLQLAASAVVAAGALFEGNPGPAEQVAPDVEAVAQQAGNSVVNLFRAVEPAELSNLTSSGIFNNPEGILVKYFSSTLEGAGWFAQQAGNAYGNVYTIVQTSISSTLFSTLDQFPADRGVPSVAVPSGALPSLTPPTVLPFVPLTPGR